MSPHIHFSIECWDQEHSEPFELPPILKKWSCDFSENCTINRSFKVLSLANSPSAASGVDGPVEEETIYLEFGAWGIGNNNPWDWDLQTPDSISAWTSVVFFPTRNPRVIHN